LIGVSVLRWKAAVSAIILAGEQEKEVSWLMRQIAASWHVLALLYLLVIWAFWLNTLVSGTERNNGVLLISLLLVPIYLLLDRIGRWLVETLVSTFDIFPENAQTVENDEETERAAVRARRFRQLLRRTLRFLTGMILLLCLLPLWGFDIPIAGNIADAVFNILVTLILALLVWRMSSRYIGRKLAEAHGEGEEERQDEMEEFGPAKQRGRAYTLLPMLRKVIATILLLMVTLIVLSSIGVDIGPLLAGAGVLGLAIGFGAQKLVSDVLSGFFYLVDDAFRVGEYIQAGALSGTVENITLRNVMLRHHRGMLQIVPYSDLGSITNFMRGGIVIKFNLEFPYDTDVDKVRKIIKKVGEQMLEDPEYGQDFIHPVKSQGVREITNSVMVIRVKFTAHPGKQFIIRREAFRLITGALAARGFRYAHRKVIVEVPEMAKDQRVDAEQIKRAVETGAAASLLAPTGDASENR
jgi:small-conductance mechanosensitive channel